MKTKLIILVILTLILGFVIGMLTSAQLRFRKLEPVRTYFSVERFSEGFYKIIEPDDEQKAKIEQILKKYSKINGELQLRIRKEIDTNFKAMRKELDSILTREQLEKLKAMDKRRQEMMRHYKYEGRKDSTRFNPGQRSFRRGPVPSSPPTHHSCKPDTLSLPDSK